MDIDWTTFLLELINFAILVWILKRFLYAPVRRALEARRERAEAALREAEARVTLTDGARISAKLVVAADGRQKG